MERPVSYASPPKEHVPFSLLCSLMVPLAFLCGCGGPPEGGQALNVMGKMVAYVGSHEPLEPLSGSVRPLDAKESLGKILFHDVRLSHDNTVACSSCHDVSNGGDDGHRFAIGIGGAEGTINSPTVLNATFNLAQFWDGRASDLKTQVAGPIHAPKEMGSSWAEVIAKLNTDAHLRQSFQSLFAEGITPNTIAECIVAYETQLITPNSPFDRYLMGDVTAVDDEVLQGYRLFKELGCAACHQGRNIGGNMFAQFGVMREFFDASPDFKRAHPIRHSDREHESLDERHIKVPTLRNIALTGPYLHDGSAETLDDAIAVMGVYQLGAELPEDDIQLLVKFLRSLTGELSEELK